MKADQNYVEDQIDGCDHSVLAFQTDVVKFNDTPLRRLIISGRCHHCGGRLQFVCIPHDRPVDEPSTSPDAHEVHLPFLLMGGVR